MNEIIYALKILRTSLRSGEQTPLFSVQQVPGHWLNGAARTAEKIPKTIFIFFLRFSLWSRSKFDRNFKEGLILYLEKHLGQRGQD